MLSGECWVGPIAIRSERRNRHEFHHKVDDTSQLSPCSLIHAIVVMQRFVSELVLDACMSMGVVDLDVASREQRKGLQ